MIDVQFIFLENRGSSELVPAYMIGYRPRRNIIKLLLAAEAQKGYFSIKENIITISLIQRSQGLNKVMLVTGYSFPCY